MNNKLEVIGIDHGWSMMKTVTQVFVTGVKEITTTPALFGDVLEYDGKYYKIGTVSDLWVFTPTPYVKKKQEKVVPIKKVANGKMPPL